jgi:hypothetical protein
MFAPSNFIIKYRFGYARPNYYAADGSFLVAN